MNSSSRIVFLRADGSKSIGMGHLKRAVLLSEMLVKNMQMQPILLTKQDDSAAAFIHRHNLNTRWISPTMSRKEELQVLSEMVARECPKLVFVDLLTEDVDSDYMKVFKRPGTFVIAITDDSRKRVIDADMVVNGNPYQSSAWYRGERARYLCGTRYFLMDAAYAKVKAKEPPGAVGKILLTFGGSDHSDILFRVLKVLEKIDQQIFVMIITSQATGYGDRLKKFLQMLSLKSELLMDVESLVAYWPQCDAAITAGGNSLFERIASRLPGATICQLERQDEIAGCFDHMEVNVNLGLGSQISDDMMEHRLKLFLSDAPGLHEQYARAPYIVDGEGLLRLEEEIRSVL